mmetsp:Transcript_5566/g.21903  ORF Transcript_5566/g.21903 Transcript_5566/m.21903 type:complete len:216 (+) Transcript_5566:423-1070(+)|eukprot:scaffold387_cov244-Pinguiococcus_pyrenoidosus.AAC.20
MESGEGCRCHRGRLRSGFGVQRRCGVPPPPAEEGGNGRQEEQPGGLLGVSNQPRLRLILIENLSELSIRRASLSNGKDDIVAEDLVDVDSSGIVARAAPRRVHFGVEACHSPERVHKGQGEQGEIDQHSKEDERYVHRPRDGGQEQGAGHDFVVLDGGPVLLDVYPLGGLAPDQGVRPAGETSSGGGHGGGCVGYRWIHIAQLKVEVCRQGQLKP